MERTMVKLCALSASDLKRRVGKVEVIEVGSSDFSAAAGGTTESSTTLSFAREVISVCGSGGGSGNGGTGLGDNDDSQTESEGGSFGGGGQSGGEKVPDGDVTDDKDDVWSLIRSQRWNKPSVDFKVPGKSFCNDETLLRVVDSTVDLLKRSKVKPFPRIRRGHNEGFHSTRGFHRQKKMYRLLKKVTICESKDGEECVFRATPIEIIDGLEEIWGESLGDDFSVHMYFEEIIAKRS